MSEEFEPVEGCAGCVANTAVEDAVAVEAPHFAPGGSDSAPSSTPNDDGEKDDGAPTPEGLAAIHARNDWLIAADQALSDLRHRSADGKLTSPERWVKRAFTPAGVDAKAFADELLSYIEEHPHAEDSPAIGRQEVPVGYDDRPELDELGLDDPLPEHDVTDIVVLYGKSGVYLYSKPIMSHSFAHALFNTAEGDDLATFADVIRMESRVYPRPTAASDFLNSPYLLSLIHILGDGRSHQQDGSYTAHHDEGDGGRHAAAVAYYQRCTARRR